MKNSHKLKMINIPLSFYFHQLAPMLILHWLWIFHPANNKLDVVWMSCSFLPLCHFIQVESCHHQLDCWHPKHFPEQRPSCPRTFLDASTSSLLIPSEFIESVYTWLLYLHIFSLIFYISYLPCYTLIFPEFRDSCIPSFFHGLPSAWFFHPTA